MAPTTRRNPTGQPLVTMQDDPERLLRHPTSGGARGGPQGVARSGARGRARGRGRRGRGRGRGEANAALAVGAAAQLAVAQSIVTTQPTAVIQLAMAIPLALTTAPAQTAPAALTVTASAPAPTSTKENIIQAPSSTPQQSRKRTREDDEEGEAESTAAASKRARTDGGDFSANESEMPALPSIEQRGTKRDRDTEDESNDKESGARTKRARTSNEVAFANESTETQRCDKRLAHADDLVAGIRDVMAQVAKDREDENDKSSEVAQDEPEDYPEEPMPALRSSDQQEDGANPWDAWGLSKEFAPSSHAETAADRSWDQLNRIQGIDRVSGQTPPNSAVTRQAWNNQRIIRDDEDVEPEPALEQTDRDILSQMYRLSGQRHPSRRADTEDDKGSEKEDEPNHEDEEEEQMEDDEEEESDPLSAPRVRSFIAAMNGYTQSRPASISSINRYSQAPSQAAAAQLHQPAQAAVAATQQPAQAAVAPSQPAQAAAPAPIQTHQLNGLTLPGLPTPPLPVVGDEGDDIDALFDENDPEDFRSSPTPDGEKLPRDTGSAASSPLVVRQVPTLTFTDPDGDDDLTAVENIPDAPEDSEVQHNDYETLEAGYSSPPRPPTQGFTGVPDGVWGYDDSRPEEEEISSPTLEPPESPGSKEVVMK